MSLRTWNRTCAAALLLALAASGASGGDDPPASEPRCVLRGEVLRAFAGAAATVEIRRVPARELTQADDEWYRRVAADRTLFATLADRPPYVTVRADATGAFEAADLPLGVFEVRAIAEDGATCCVAARATYRGETVRVTADLPGGPLTVTGRAVRRDGTPFLGLVAIDARDFEKNEYGGSRVVSWPGAVETDADGKFTIRGVADDLHRLVAVDPISFVARSTRFLGAAAPEFVVDGGTREIAGTVVDEATGAAVPRAIVACPNADDPWIAVEADMRGAFRLAVPDGATEFAVSASGFVRGVASIRGGETTIRLVRTAKVTGRVTADGKPVAGARVLAVPTASGKREVERVTRTNADGRYEIAIDERGSWAVFVLDDAWISPEAAEQDPYDDWNPLAVWVEPGDRLTADRTAIACARLSGVLADAAGKPVAGARIETWPSDGSLWSGVSDRLPLAASAADGSFRVGTIPGRNVTVWAHAGKWDSEQVNVPATPPGGAVSHKLTFRAAEVARFVVRRPDRAPVGGAVLRLHSQSGCLAWEYGEVRSYADGHADSGPLETRSPSVSVTADGFVDTDVEDAELSADPFEIVVTGGKRIASRVVLPKGAPRGDLWLDVVRLPPAGGGGDESKLDTFRAADDGSFRTVALPRGRYRIDAKLDLADGRAWIGSAVGTTEEFPASVELAPSGEALRSFVIRVVDAAGRPVTRGAVTVNWKEPGYWTGVAGRVESGIATVALPPRAQTVWVLVDGLAPGLACAIGGPFDPTAASPEICVVPEAKISGSVRTNDSTPIPGVTISAFTAIDHSGGAFPGPRATTRTGADGRFELRGLCSGLWEIRGEPLEGLTLSELCLLAPCSGLDLLAGPGIAAAIRVVDWNGVPVAGATVIVRHRVPEGSDPIAVLNTGTSGSVRIARLADPSSLVLLVKPPRDRGDLREWRYDSWSPRDSEIRLVRDYVLSGVVADASGRGVDGVVVWARASGGAWNSAETRGGSFTLPHLEQAAVDVVVVRSGEPGSRATQKLTIGDEPVRLLYEPGPSISVELGRTALETMGNAGLDLAYRATLLLGDDPSGPLVTTQIVREGHTSVFDHLKDGERYSLWITADPDVRTWSLDGMCVFHKGLTPGEFASVTPAPGRSIEGRLTSPGRALPGKVRVTASLGSLRCAAEVKGDRFVVRGLVEGLWTIEAEAKSDGRVLAARAEVEAGETADLELRIR